MTEALLPARKSAITKAAQELIRARNGSASGYNDIQSIVLARHGITPNEVVFLLAEITDQDVSTTHRRLTAQGLPVDRKIVNVLFRVALTLTGHGLRPVQELFRRTS